MGVAEKEIVCFSVSGCQFLLEREKKRLKYLSQ